MLKINGLSHAYLAAWIGAETSLVHLDALNSLSDDTLCTTGALHIAMTPWKWKEKSNAATVF